MSLSSDVMAFCVQGRGNIQGHGNVQRHAEGKTKILLSLSRLQRRLLNHVASPSPSRATFLSPSPAGLPSRSVQKAPSEIFRSSVEDIMLLHNQLPFLLQLAHSLLPQIRLLLLHQFGVLL